MRALVQASRTHVPHHHDPRRRYLHAPTSWHDDVQVLEPILRDESIPKLAFTTARMTVEIQGVLYTVFYRLLTVLWELFHHQPNTIHSRYLYSSDSVNYCAHRVSLYRPCIVIFCITVRKQNAKTVIILHNSSLIGIRVVILHLLT